MRTEPFAADALQRDAFLGGRVWIWQPLQGYRAGIDPVLLAASVPAQAGQAVLELGCGAGPALCCLGHRVAGLDLAGIELQPAYAGLARRNLEENGLSGTVWTGDLRQPPPGMRARSFDHVIANPPYFEAGKRAVADAADRETALAGDTPLADWIATATRRLKPRGMAHVIQRVERLPELMHAMYTHLGTLELIPLLPREGRAPRLILMRGRKDGRAPFRCHPGIVLHRGALHERDGEDYTDLLRGVMREGLALPVPA